ncbi:MAG: VWA domain-containing protein, partial [Planctomycetota bacterium]
QKLANDVRFNIVTFGSDVKQWQKFVIPAMPPNKQEACKFTDEQKPLGGTNMYDALKLAFKDRNADTFYVLSDGAPTAGEVTDTEQLLEWVRSQNSVRQVVIHTISAGELTSNDFLKRMAEENGGKSVELK